MENVLREVLVGTRGGPNRTRILRALDERPRNTSRLAEDLELDYKTVTHHLDVLEENGVVRCSDHGYGEIYLLSDQAQHHWELIEEMAKPVV